MLNWGKVWADFFIFLALSSNVGFLVSRDPYQLVLALGVNLIATVLKFGAKKALGAELLSTGFLSVIHLIPATFLYFSGTSQNLAVGLAAGAVVANLISLLFVILDLIMEHRERH